MVSFYSHVIHIRHCTPFKWQRSCDLVVVNVSAARDEPHSRAGAEGQRLLAMKMTYFPHYFASNAICVCPITNKPRGSHTYSFYSHFFHIRHCAPFKWQRSCDKVVVQIPAVSYEGVVIPRNWRIQWASPQTATPIENLTTSIKTKALSINKAIVLPIQGEVSYEGGVSLL